MEKKSGRRQARARGLGLTRPVWFVFQLHEYKSSSHRIFRLNNIAKALKFLEDSNVKLVSIDAAEIADGNPSLVLGLIWNIILFFQVKPFPSRNTQSRSPCVCLGPTEGVGPGPGDSEIQFPTDFDFSVS